MKRISRHIWADYLEEAVHLRRTERNKKIYSQRKETIERVFADMKEKHGMWWTTLRGLRKVSMQAMLVFACMNLKKLATWLWRSGGSKHNFTTLCLYIVLKIRQTPEFYSEQRSLSAIWGDATASPCILLNETQSNKMNFVIVSIFNEERVID